MKFKIFLMVGLILAILTIGAVSAEDNITSEMLTVEENVIENPLDDSLELSDSFDDELKGEDVNLTVEHEKVMTKDDYLWIASSDNDGRISILVDGQQIYYYNSFWFYNF